MIFNERLKILREEKCLTQESTARALDMPLRTYNRLSLMAQKRTMIPC